MCDVGGVSGPKAALRRGVPLSDAERSGAMLVDAPPPLTRLEAHQREHSPDNRALPENERSRENSRSGFPGVRDARTQSQVSHG